MNCPVCNSPLKNIQYEGQSVDLCVNCEGIWLDEGELQQIVRNLLSGNKVDYQSVEEAYRNKPITYSRQKMPVRICPKCNVRMSVFNYYADSNVFLDRCASCGGIWLDKSEIMWVAKYMKGNPKIDRYVQALSESYLRLAKAKLETEEISKTSRDLMGSNLGKFYAIWYTIFPIPLKDDLPTKRFPKITIGLIVLNTLIFIFQSIFFHTDLVAYFNLFGVIPALGFSIDRLYTFITSMFVHGGLLHIAGNMYYLWIFGDNVEDRMGSLKFMIFYFLCGISGDFVFCLMQPSLNEPAIGASGAISGVLGAYLLLYPRQCLETIWLGRKREIPAANYLIFWIIMQLFIGTISLATKDAEVAYWAHIGGFVSGLILLRLFVQKSKQ
ncbi:MAG: rhomboid family intramembrane serine protease [Candidatus Omnitrophica bacterium]|nr:rhomboid family intramembrane serine protease [Candidatus Omnitrophota bacterium]